MIILSKYKTKYNPQKQAIQIIPDLGQDEPRCPFCGGELILRDHCTRTSLELGGDATQYYIRRMKCSTCGAIHRELPDSIVPYKHYSAEVIGGVVDGSVSEAVLDEVSYPCETTVNRWNAWFALNQNNIEGILRVVGYNMLHLGEDFLLFVGSILALFMPSRPDWLETIDRIVYNSGHRLVPLESRWQEEKPPPSG
ncbi:MAG: DUF6431 domain-containing protein [Clostridiales bacterium]|nr:DUF6431 domain-containing protein [Clostridiales bacterium]